MVNKVDGIGHKPAIDRMEVLMDGLFTGRNIIIPPVCYNKKRYGFTFKVQGVHTGSVGLPTNMFPGGWKSVPKVVY